MLSDLADVAAAADQVCVILHGQTGAGKTFTALKLHQVLGERTHGSFSQENQDVWVSYYELDYTGAIRDLVAEADEKIVKTTNDLPRKVASFPEMVALMSKGEDRRSSRETVTHASSSRSHAVCEILIREKSTGSSPAPAEEVKRFVIVDLAGMENSEQSFENRGQAMRESQFINSSLSSLHDCVRCLEKNLRNPSKKVMVPFRNSKLTMLLRPVLEGLANNDPESESPSGACSTALVWVAHLTPGSWHASQSKKSLQMVKLLKQASDLKKRNPVKLGTVQLRLSPSEYSERFLSQSALSPNTKIEGLCGCFIKGRTPADFEFLSDEPNKSLPWVCSAGMLSGLPGKDPCQALLSIGMCETWIRERLRARWNQVHVGPFSGTPWRCADVG